MASLGDTHRSWAFVLLAAIGILALFSTLPDAAEGSKASKCKKKPRKCDRNVADAATSVGGGSGLLAPWPAGTRFVIGGDCGGFGRSKTHRARRGVWKDDSEAIDIGICGKRDYGVPVLAAQDGTVKLVERRDQSAYGETVVIEADDGTATRYAHLSEVTVSFNQQVVAGERIGAIGYSGAEGDSKADSHLHFAQYSGRGDGAGIKPDPLAGFILEDETAITSFTNVVETGAAPFMAREVARSPAATELRGYPGETIAVSFAINFDTGDAELNPFDPANFRLRPLEHETVGKYTSAGDVSGTAVPGQPEWGVYLINVTIPPGAQPGPADTLRWNVVNAATGQTVDPGLTFSVVVEPAPPVTTITAAPPAVTNSGMASLAFAAPGAVSYECALDGAAFSGCTSPAGYSGLAVGGHTFRVRATDANNNVGPTQQHNWTVIANAPPTVTIKGIDATIGESPNFYQALAGDGTSRVYTDFTFDATDSDGVDHYDVILRANGVDGAPVTVSEPSDGSDPTANFLLSPGVTYQLKVRATDDKGVESVTSSYVSGPQFKPFVYDATSSNVGYTPAGTGTWEQPSCDACYGSTLRRSEALNSTASFAFTGFDGAVVAFREGNGGRASVKVDTVWQGTADTYRGGYQARSVVYNLGTFTQGNHTILLTTTTSAPKRFGLDAFIVFTTP